MDHTSTVPHITGADAFQKEVMESQQPVLVDFYAEWCGPCKMAAPVMEQLSTEFAGKAKVVKVDVDVPENRAMVMQFGVRSIPTVVMIKGGKVDSQNIGFIGEDGYRGMIDDALAA